MRSGHLHPAHSPRACASRINPPARVIEAGEPPTVSVVRVFTGIVEELGTVVERDGSRLRIAARTVLEGSDLGASIAVNGCCLTVVARGDGWWDADVSDETYSRTNLGSLRTGDRVNLERPVALGARLGGHLVLGHVDAVGEVVSPAPDLCVRIPRDLMHLVVEKGSITLDGVSLTAFGLGDDTLGGAVIPHTAENTTLGAMTPGTKVNVEMDVLAKHIARLAEAGRSS